MRRLFQNYITLTDGSTMFWRDVRALQDRGQADRRSFACDACGEVQLLEQACRLGAHAVCLSCAMLGIAVSPAGERTFGSPVIAEVCDEEA